MSESPLIRPENRPQQRQAATGHRILVIDPQPEGRALLKAALRSLESVESVREVSNARHLEQVYDQQRVDVMMIEHDLPEDDPFDVVRRVKEIPAAQQTKFVLMSAGLDTEARRQGTEVGILGYLAKPFDMNSLERALRDAMGKVSTNHKDTLNRVRRIDFFSDFDDNELIRLLKICHTRKYHANEPIFDEGERGDRLYVLVAGKVDIRKQHEGGSDHLATVHPGEVFGEMALVDQEPRSAAAVAQTDCMLIEVNAEIINDVQDILALKLFRKIAMFVTKKLRNYTAQNIQQQHQQVAATAG